MIHIFHLAAVSSRRHVFEKKVPRENKCQHGSECAFKRYPTHLSHVVYAVAPSRRYRHGVDARRCAAVLDVRWEKTGASTPQCSTLA